MNERQRLSKDLITFIILHNAYSRPETWEHSQGRTKSNNTPNRFMGCNMQAKSATQRMTDKKDCVTTSLEHQQFIPNSTSPILPAHRAHITNMGSVTR